MADDFSRCLVSNSRMAARAITRRYDAYLRPFGITATQLLWLNPWMIEPEPELKAGIGVNLDPARR